MIQHSSVSTLLGRTVWTMSPVEWPLNLRVFQSSFQCTLIAIGFDMLRNSKNGIAFSDGLSVSSIQF